MTFKNRHLLAALAALGLGLCLTPAQAVQFRLLGWASQDVNLVFDKDSKPVELMVPQEQFSLPQTAKDTAPIVLYKMVEVDGNPRRQIACSIPIPEGMEQGIIVLLPGDESQALSKKVLPNSAGFRTENAPVIYNYVWLDDSLKSRPSRSIELRNLSSLPVAVQLDTHQLTLAPQAKAIVPITPGTARMPLQAATRMDGKWKLFASRPLRTATIDRVMVFFRDTPAADQANGAAPAVSMLPIYDWPQPPADTKASVVASR